MNAQLQHCPRWPVIGLMDANSSRLGSVTSRAVGEAGMTVENTAGAWFHEWLLHNQFWLPSTFENTHQGEHHTWYHATGASARLDYVTLSEHFTPSQVRSWVSTDIDVSLQCIDHLPVCCAIDVWLVRDHTKSQTQEKPRRKPSRQPSAPVFKQIPWTLNVHQHADQLDTVMRNFQRMAPFTQKLRKKHLTEPTWLTILAKRNSWRKVIDIRRQVRIGYLRDVWYGWKRVAQAVDSPPQVCDFRSWHRWTDFELARWLYLHGKFTPLGNRSSTSITQSM